MSDSGVGFTPADGARLFEKFTRLHPGGGGSYYGTGPRSLHRAAADAARARPGAARTSDGVGQGAHFVLTWPAARRGSRSR